MPVSSSNLAVITLTSKVPITTSVAPGILSNETKLDVFVGENLLVCGFGFINNQKEKSKTLKCTNIRSVPIDDCIKAAANFWPAYKSVLSPKVRFQIIFLMFFYRTPKSLPGAICTRNFDDKNACGGDIGSPVFSNKTGTLIAVGVVSSYPDSRSHAHCQDGHHVIVMRLGMRRFVW